MQKKLKTWQGLVGLAVVLAWVAVVAVGAVGYTGGGGAEGAGVQFARYSTFDSVRINHLLNTQGAADFDSTVNVDGAATFGSTVEVAGAVTFDDLGVAGDLTVDGATALDGGLTMDTDAFTVADGTGNTVIDGTLDVDETTNLDVVDIDGAVDMASTLDVDGNTTMTGTLDVDGATTVDGFTADELANLDGGIAVDTDAFTVADTSGNTAVGGTLGVDGNATLGDAITDNIYVYSQMRTYNGSSNWADVSDISALGRGNGWQAAYNLTDGGGDQFQALFVNTQVNTTTTTGSIYGIEAKSTFKGTEGSGDLCMAYGVFGKVTAKDDGETHSTIPRAYPIYSILDVAASNTVTEAVNFFAENANSGTEAASYILKTHSSGDTWDYGIHMGDATINTAEIVGSNGETLGNTVDGLWTVGGAELVDGAADVIQLRVQGNAIQSNNPNLFVVETSTGTDLFWVDNTGDAELNGTSPTFTIGDAGEEDTAVVFDGAAQDFYAGLYDTDDDFQIGLGSAVGTTPIIVLDENQEMGIGGASAGAKLDVTGNVEIDGGDDEVQLTVQGYSTQTSDLVLVETSDGTDRLNINDYGKTVFSVSPDADTANYDRWVTIQGYMTGKTTKDRNYGLYVSMQRPAGQELDVGDHDEAGIQVRVDTHAVTTTAGTTLRAIDGEAKADNPGGTVTNLYGGTFTAKSDTDAGSVGRMIALTANSQANAEVTDAMMAADLRLMRQSANEPTAEYVLQVRNSSTAGSGADAGIYVTSDYSSTHAADNMDYGIDFSTADITTADVRFENGTTLAEDVDTVLTFSEFLAPTEQTAVVVTEGSIITPTGTYQPITSAGAVTTSATIAIADGVKNGQLLVIVNENASDTIIVKNGANTHLSGDITLGNDDTLGLMWDGADWLELFTTDNS